MNKKNLAHIIADPTALAQLQRCSSVNELVTCLNWAGAECTREEGLRFLRTWENMATENEPLDEDELDNISGGVGFIDTFKSMFGFDTIPTHKLVHENQSNPLTIEMILNEMER